ncbi:MAG: FxsA family protein [Motiliproteus sp.]
MRFLFLLFVIVPIIEILLLINVGEIIGAWYTVGLVLLSAFIGVNMLRRQGLATLMRARSRMDSGEIPAHEMIEGIILAVGGALLITPGFVTDFIGFCCLIPFTRHGLVRKLQKHFTLIGTQQAGFGDFNQSDFQQPPSGDGDRPSQRGSTYDGEYRHDD